MESEKVKEIKKALKCCSEGKCEKCLIGKKDIRKCVDILLKDTLTLINELENENERLRKCREADYKTMTALRQANTELNECMDEMQDRIVELEKENESKTNTITDLLKKQEFYETEKLKQFAKRLKEKAHKGASCDSITYKFIERDYTITESELNELLKEYEE